VAQPSVRENRTSGGWTVPGKSTTTATKTGVERLHHPAALPLGPVREAQYRRQVGHDIRHELSTIRLLASVLTTSKDVGPVSRGRVGQILAETVWLEELIRAYDEASDGRDSLAPDVIRIDTLVDDILRPIRLSSRTRISLDAEAVSAQVNRLAFWRALRNIICNAQAASGADGSLAVSVSASEGFVVVDVDDDGPGFDPELSTPSSLGLRITAELVDSWGGHLQIGQGSLGGCRVRLALPEAPGA
jgi:signal transduction histidine kinase